MKRETRYIRKITKQTKTLTFSFVSLFFICSVTLFAFTLAAAACAQDVPIAPREPQKKNPQETAKVEPAPPQPRIPADNNKFAIIISGIGGEAEYTKQFAEWTGKLRGALVENLGFAEEQVTVFTEKPQENELRVSADLVKQTFASLSSAVKADHQVFIFFIGHGSFDDKTAKFNLAGPDLSASEYAELIKKLPASQIVVVNMASASGEFIKPLSGKNRIVVTATRSGMEKNATIFAEHFIAALGNPEADSDKNGRVSVLEAFNFGTKLTSDSYEQEGKIVTEHALIDDNGDGVGHQKAESGDGALARTSFFDSLPKQQAGGDPELAKLFSERMRLEGEVEQLKARKENMKEDEYESALEKILVELAKVNQTIKAKQK
jgi:Peptidase C13 family